MWMFSCEVSSAITVFHGAVAGLAMADDATLGSLVTEEDRAPFADGWIRALVAKGDRTARLAAARTAIVDRRTRIGSQVRRIRARRDELAPRRNALLNDRERLLG
ncbi:MAG: hypothetical protein H0V17_30185 [Deltaproteobacteria bacterium]|nr:hypothetical protein [Deltaproteobacteria bacterium]